MKKSLHEVIEIIKNYNAWRRGSKGYNQPNPTELGLCIDQAVEMLKTMNKTSKEQIIELHTGKTVEEIEKNNRIVKTLVSWQPMETAPKDREFLGVWGDCFEPSGKSVDLFRYDQDAQQYVWSNYGGAVHVPIHELFAWMEIPKYEG